MKIEVEEPKPAAELECCLPYVDVRNLTACIESIPETAREQINWPGYKLGIDKIWAYTKGEGINVAVLDTGVDIDHQDLKQGVTDSVDFTGDGVEDKNGHGTHCAGIVGARLNNVGFVGVAPKCNLLIGKVLNNRGQGAISWICKGIIWAVNSGAHIISMSLGAPRSDPYLYSAIQYALSRGVFVICAAGNSGANRGNSVEYPGRYGGVITIASHDIYGNRSGFSSRGGEVDFMGPGSDIWSTYRDGGYAELDGTSMAAPFVAGLAALILAKQKSGGISVPLENTEDLRNQLMRMATHPEYFDSKSGYGALKPFNYFAG